MKFKGLIPALANDFLSLTPDKIFATLQGRSIGDLFVVQPCPTIKEGFADYNKCEDKTRNLIMVIFLIVAICVGLTIVNIIRK